MRQIYDALSKRSLVSTVADSSIFTFTFTFVELLAGTVRDSITVDSGLIDALTKAGDPKFIGNNRRITAAAFLMDRAGNLSALTGIDTDGEPNAQPTRDPNIHVLDLTPATISPVRPKTATGELPDSSRFTALTETARASPSSTWTNGTTSPDVSSSISIRSSCRSMKGSRTFR